MALIEDPKFKVWVEKYAADQELFFKDFALAFAKLIGGWCSSRIVQCSWAELGIDRDDTGFAQLAHKAAAEGKPLDKVSAPSGGCPFAGAAAQRRDAKL
jgi:peroxiredoxin